MNLQQFRCVRETYRCSFNLTEAARSLRTSQPAVSKSIIELEHELGVQIFQRHGKRLRGLTRHGEQVLDHIKRILLEVENLQKMRDEFTQNETGSLVVACTHAQARYILPRVILEFRQRFPKVRVALAEGNPPDLAKMVLHGKADVAIATESLHTTPGLAVLPVYEWGHVVVVLPDHPLAELAKANKALSLTQLAQYPLITYDHAFSARSEVDRTFEAHDLPRDVVLSAIDADIIKTYVRMGLGVGLIAGMAYQPEEDTDFVGLPVSHLFGRHTTNLALKSGSLVRDYVYEFIGMLSNNLSRDRVDAVLAREP